MVSVEVVVISARVVNGRIKPRFMRVHDRAACAGRGLACVVHSPSVHHMRDWELNWRDDTGLMERLCVHGVGHPDPDHITWVLRCDPNMTWHGYHGCDGCCMEGYNT